MSFFRDVSFNFSKQFTMIICGLITSIVINRVLGPTDRGIYALVMLIPSILILLGDLGVNASNIYHIGRKKIEPNDAAINSLTIGLLVGLSLALFAIFLIPSVEKFITPGVPTIYSIIAILAVPFTLTSGFLSSVFVGLKRIKEISIISIITTVVSTIAIAIILLFLNGGVKGLLILSLVTGISTMLFYFFYINKKIGFSRQISRSYIRESMIFGSKPYIANAINFFNRRLSFFILGCFIGAVEVGYYSVAIGLAELIWIIPSAIGFVLFPSVANADSTSGGQLTALSCRFVFFISTTLCIVTAILGSFIIQILYGSPFSPSYLPLLLLLPGILINSTGSLTSSYLNGIGKVIYAPFINGTELILAIILNLLLIPSFGIIGASIATSICLTYDGLMSMHFFIKHSKIRLKDTYLLTKKDLKILMNKIYML